MKSCQLVGRPEPTTQSIFRHHTFPHHHSHSTTTFHLLRAALFIYLFSPMTSFSSRSRCARSPTFSPTIASASVSFIPGGTSRLPGTPRITRRVGRTTLTSALSVRRSMAFIQAYSTLNLRTEYHEINRAGTGHI